MRLTIIIILIAVIQLSAKNTRGQKLTYSKDNTTISQIFKEIKRQTGYNVVWYEGKLNSHEPIDVNFYNTPLDKVMDNVLDGRAVTYQIIGKAIVVKAGGPSFRDKVTSTLATIDVRGRVLDENNEPLVGAVVKVKGSTTSTSTSSNGDFLLKNIDENATLIISFLGYETQEVKVAKNIPSIKLTPSTDKLEEVEINAGYYTVTDRERTGAISKVTSATIAKQPVNNPLMALQGRVSGLEITQLTGMPGGGFKVQIRGRSSIGSSIGNDPLYIIDGVIYSSAKLNSNRSDGIYGGGTGTIGTGVSPLSMFSPSDIESIEILKDADATAIYGSRGANGVVLITTKRGVAGDLKFNANVSQGFSEVGHQLDLLNTEQYIAMRMEAFKNDGITPSATDYDVNGVWDKTKYTNWQEEFIGHTANIINTSLNISGGSISTNYLIGANYSSEGTVFPGDFGFKRGGVRTNLNLKSPTSKLQIGIMANYSYAQSNFPQLDPTTYIIRAPNSPNSFDENGKLNWIYNNVSIPSNPRASLLNTEDANTSSLIGNLNLSYHILKKLVLRASVGYTTMRREELAKSKNIARNPATNPTSANRTSQFGNTSNNSWIAEPQLDYSADIGAGKLSALIGMSFQQNITEYRNVTASNFNSDELMDNISSASVFSIGQANYTTYKYAAAFVRVNYALVDKYFLNLVGRRDASSRFGPGRQFANFGSIGASWIFSDEKLIKDNFDFLSFGKFRMSYGITGNDQIQDYQFLQLFVSGDSYQGNPTIRRNRISNSDYGWETNKKAEAALQLGFFKDKINLQIAYYRNRSSNQLLSIPLAPSVGATSVNANLPATVQNSGWEFEGAFKILTRKNWSWSTNFNLSIPRNKLIAYPNLSSSSNANILVIGEPLSIVKIYNTTLDTRTGLYATEDYNKNGLRDQEDLYLNKFIGPTLYGGLNNSIRFKQFNLDFLISFTKQTGLSLLQNFQNTGGRSSTGSINSNRPTVVLSRWQQPGDITDIAKFSTSNNNANYLLGVGASGIQAFSDNSFARIKNVSLSYSLTNSLLSRLRIRDLQINIQGQNLFTLTKYEGLDPENSNIVRLPPLRTISLGIKLTI